MQLILKKIYLNNFQSLGLSQELLQVLPELGFEVPTPIQAKTIPILINQNQDFIGLAQTGTGKTAAFGLPLLDLIDTSLDDTQAVIMAPTRELCQQITQQLEVFARYIKRLKMVAVYGGADITRQMKALQKPTQLIVATPGRLFDLIKRKKIKLDQVRYVVLDEADEMLNMGFREELDQILAFTPAEKKTWLFSATMPNEIRDIVHKYMHNPAEVAVMNGQRINENIEHQFITTKASFKEDLLTRILEVETELKGIVFCRTRKDTQELAAALTKRGLPVEALHGDLSQAQRDVVMKRFKQHQTKVIIATDVAARGLDVDDLTMIIHYNLPDNAEYYTHRSGRTARAGKKGISLALVTKAERKRVSELERKLKISFQEKEAPSWNKLVIGKIENWADELLGVQYHHKIVATAVEKVTEKFETLDKEELIKRLVQREMQQFVPPIEEDSSSEKLKPAKSRSGKENNKPVKGGKKKNTHRYFINIGKIDEVDQEDLHHFICNQAKLRMEEVSDIAVKDKFAFFEVDSRIARKVDRSFKGLTVDGRKLRVNRA